MKRFAGVTACLALSATLCAPAPAAAQGEEVYRVVTAQAAPGRVLELIELYRDERSLADARGEQPPFWMRHTQGDIWDLFVMYPIGSMSEYFSDAAVSRRAGGRSAAGRSGSQLQAAIDAATAWREEVFVHGPPLAEVKREWDNAGFYHIEIFEGLAGKRQELLRERAMENAYAVALGRDATQVFTRIAGSSTDAFTVGYYADLKAYANPPEVTPEQVEKAAVDAGFQGSAYIGAYLRSLILRHHDSLGIPLADPAGGNDD